jgi:hypothetical protein
MCPKEGESMLMFLSQILGLATPFLLVLIPFLLVLDITLRLSEEKPEEPPPAPDISALEEKLNALIKNNREQAKNDSLKAELSTSHTNIMAGYLRLTARDLPTAKVFQIIFSLLKNHTPDERIIKVLKHHFPECADTHLYALLRAFKLFLEISIEDEKKNALLNALYRHQIRPILLYLQQKISATLNRLPEAEESTHSALLAQATRYALTFAAFSEFYDSDTTEKILRLSALLSPQEFQLWHTRPPQKSFKRKNNLLSFAKKM